MCREIARQFLWLFIHHRKVMVVETSCNGLTTKPSCLLALAPKTEMIDLGSFASFPFLKFKFCVFL